MEIRLVSGDEVDLLKRGEFMETRFVSGNKVSL